MTARVVGAVARHESEHKSERIRSKMNQLREEGWMTGGGRRPFGFKRYVKAGTLTAAQYTQAFSYDALGRLTTGPLGSYAYGAAAHVHAATAIGTTWTAALYLTLPNGGRVYIPNGFTAVPSESGNGIDFRPPTQAVRNAGSIRVMPPGADPKYPTGYFRYYNQTGQPLDAAGKPGPPAETHFPL